MEDDDDIQAQSSNRDDTSDDMDESATDDIEESSDLRDATPGMQDSADVLANIMLVRSGSQSAFRNLLRRHTGLIARYARMYKRTDCNLGFEELFSAGAEGLWQAALIFDSGRGVRFTTFAVPVITRTISRFARLSGEQIRLPDHLGRLRDRVDAAESELYNLTGLAPPVSAIAAKAGLSKKDVLEIRKYRFSVTGTDNDTDNDDFDDAYSQLAAPDDSFAEVDDLDLVKSLLTDLDEREQSILIWRLNLLGYGKFTCKQIARRLKISSERVRQIEHAAYAKLRAKRVLSRLRQVVSSATPTSTSLPMV